MIARLALSAAIIVVAVSLLFGFFDWAELFDRVFSGTRRGRRNAFLTVVGIGALVFLAIRSVLFDEGEKSSEPVDAAKKTKPSRPDDQSASGPVSRRRRRR